MSINESPPYRPSGLTPTQQHDATAAIYGINTSFDSSAPVTAEQAEFLRSVLARYDQDNSQVAEFDLNKPPHKPYRYQEFPRMIYHHERHVYTIVQSQPELEHYLGQGWTKEAFVPEVVEVAPALTAADQRESAYFDAELRRKPPVKK